VSEADNIVLVRPEGDLKAFWSSEAMSGFLGSENILGRVCPAAMFQTLADA
jgi:hypothetical protein